MQPKDFGFVYREAIWPVNPRKLREDTLFATPPPAGSGQCHMQFDRVIATNNPDRIPLVRRPTLMEHLSFRASRNSRKDFSGDELRWFKKTHG